MASSEPIVVETRVDLGVHAGDEEGRDRLDAGEVEPGVAGSLEAGQVGVHDLLVADLAEDQGDVDADALGDGVGDRRQTLLGGGDLDQDVGAVDRAPEGAGRGDGALGVVGQGRLDLDRDPAVGALLAGERCEDVARVADVLGGELEDDPVDGLALVDELGDLLVVAFAVGDRGGEDRRVGGHADHGLGLDELGQVAGLDALAGQVVEPDRHPCFCQGLQSVTHGSSWGVEVVCGGDLGQFAAAMLS